MLKKISPIEERLDKIRDKMYQTLQKKFKGNLSLWLKQISEENKRLYKKYGYSKRVNY